ncbi:MAG: hypothetical protein ACFFHD_15875 [Promethearchaeota archaeon]
MGRKGLIGLSIVAMIIGASGLGLSAFMYIQTQFGTSDENPEGVVLEIFYKYDDTGTFGTPGDYVILHNLNITFNIGSGEAVYFLYTGTGGAYSIETIGINFVLDGKILMEPSTGFQNPSGGVFLTSVASLALQYSNTTLSEGLHEITIAFYESDGPCSISNSILYGEIYIP